ncbi:MAG: phenylalanine--tRNA ligase subunit beta [Acidobacteriota bacterium]|nr:phenylalanine--tRNA ligase subunit beta [Acidobacteriota bacterium]
MKFALEWIDEYLSEPQPADRSRALLDQAGLPVESVEKTADGDVFDVEITPNRPDAMSHSGLAREIAALSATPLAPPGSEFSRPESSGEEISTLASVKIEARKQCLRFGALLVRGLSAAPAPERVRRRLAAIGSHSIGAAVDATNYALWALGQPLHAFDFEKLRGGAIVIRKARRGETLVTLDGVERRLQTSDVVVADSERAVSLAGIMGGLDTAVTESTRHVLLEAAWWDPVSIRRTARRLGIHTDASHRFERGADISAIPPALHLAANLILRSAGGALAPGFLDARGEAFKPRRAALRLSRLRLLAGDPEIPLDFAREALSRLGFEAQPRGRRISVGIPTGRHDVREEDDLVEEVLRVWGYDRLPSRLPPATSPGRYLEPMRLVEESLADTAVAAGLFENVGYPFTDRTEQESPWSAWLDAAGVGPPISVANPLDDTRRNLRGTLLPGLLDAVSANARHGRNDAALFEIGRAFGRAEGDPADPPSLESRRFGFALSGEVRTHWSAGTAGRAWDFFDAKGLVERVLEPWIAPESLVWEPAVLDGLAPGTSAWVRAADGGLLAVVGLVSRRERDRRSLPESVFAGEILVDRIPTSPREAPFAAYSSFPPVDADLSFAHDRALAWAVLAGFVAEQGLAGLEDFRVMDRWEGAGVAPGRTKTTLRLTFRSGERTLSQEEVNRERDRLVEALKSRFGVEF